MSVPATTTDKTPQAPRKAPRQLRITKQIRAAIEQMVWHGLKRADAAKAAGLKDNSLYVALRRPDVKAHYLAELDVLRTSERARNIHTLAEVRDQTSNQMARVQAVKALEQIDEQAAESGNRSNALPGLQIVVVTNGAQAPMVDVTPGPSIARSSSDVGPDVNDIKAIGHDRV